MRLTRCSRSGPRTFRGSPLSGADSIPSAGSVPTETVLGPGPVGATPRVPSASGAPASRLRRSTGAPAELELLAPAELELLAPAELELLVEVTALERRSSASCLAISSSAAAPRISPLRVPGRRAVASRSIFGLGSCGSRLLRPRRGRSEEFLDPGDPQMHSPAFQVWRTSCLG